MTKISSYKKLLTSLSLSTSQIHSVAKSYCLYFSLNQQMLLGYFLRARYNTRYFKCINSFYFHSNPTKMHSVPIVQMRNQTERDQITCPALHSQAKGTLFSKLLRCFVWLFFFMTIRTFSCFIVMWVTCVLCPCCRTSAIDDKGKERSGSETKQHTFNFTLAKQPPDCIRSLAS